MHLQTYISDRKSMTMPTSGYLLLHKLLNRMLSVIKKEIPYRINYNQKSGTHQTATETTAQTEGATVTKTKIKSKTETQ
ncbi:MAG: hypothetical protein K1X61_03205 [Chitinophagales bacterium]|nr:hypothetical protein [Chitinophagales bacterium]